MGATLGRGLILTALLAGCGARSSLDTASRLVDAQAPVREAATVTRDAEREAASCTEPPPLSLPPAGCPDAASRLTILVAAWLDGGVRNYSNCDPVNTAGSSGAISDDIFTAGPDVTMFFVSAPKTPEVVVGSVGSGGPLQVPWYCAGPGSEVDAAAPIRLEALRALGTCAGAPEVPGGIVLSGTQFEITLNGRTTAAALSSSQEGATFSSSVMGFTPVGYIEALFDASGRLISGSVMFTDLGPDPGAVYCITSGTSTLSGGLIGDYSLGGLRRLGSCADAPRLPSCNEILIGWHDPTGQ